MSGYKIWGAPPKKARARRQAYSRVGSTPQQLITWVVGLFQDGKDAQANFEEEGNHFINCAMQLQQKLGGPPTIAPAGVLQIGKFTKQDWMALRAEVASGFRQVASGEEWRLPAEQLAGHEHIVAAGCVRHQAPARARFLLACERVLSLPDGGRLKVCNGPDCDRLFIRRKRGAFCSPKCWRNERARRTRQNLTPEKLRERRHRYYVNRVAKHRGKAVAEHVRERPRRRPTPKERTPAVAHALTIAPSRPALRKDLLAFLKECPNNRTLQEHIDGGYEHCVGVFRTKDQAVEHEEGLGPLECWPDGLVPFGTVKSRFLASPAQNRLLSKTARTIRRNSRLEGGDHERKGKRAP